MAVSGVSLIMGAMAWPSLFLVEGSHVGNPLAIIVFQASGGLLSVSRSKGVGLVEAQEA